MKKILIYVIGMSSLMFSSLSLFAAGEQDIGAGSGSTESYAKVGMSGGQFLKVAHGARGNGMAGAVSALTNDLSSVFWNPAGIAELNSLSAEFDHTAWFASLSHNFASVGLPVMDGFAFALHFTSLSTPEMERTTIEKPAGMNSYFSASDVSVGASFAGFLTDQFSFGITGRYLNNTLADASSSGFSFDIGTKYRTGIQGIILGVSLHGLTTELTYSGNEFNKTLKLINSQWAAPVDVRLIPTSYNIPLVFRANVAFDILGSADKQQTTGTANPIDVGTTTSSVESDHYLVGAIDFTTTSDSPEQFAVGLEYVWKKLLALRAGYRIGNDIQGFSVGAGVNYQISNFTGKVDYAFSPLMYDLGFAHRVSIGIDLGN